jgi:hypothetical protein
MGRPRHVTEHWAACCCCAGVLHTILFNRALGPVRPCEVESELFDICYVRPAALDDGSRTSAEPAVLKTSCTVSSALKSEAACFQAERESGRERKASTLQLVAGAHTPCITSPVTESSVWVSTPPSRADGALCSSH